MTIPADRPIGRRRMLVAGGGMLAASGLVACDALQTAPEKTGDGSGKSGSIDTAGTEASNGPEAPMVAEQVKAGKLPRVEERLPKEPLTVEVNDRIGSYGGEWNTLLEGPTGNYGWLDTTINYEGLTRWDPQFTELLPNVARDWKISEDGSQITLRLREGMKWSDGEPFTADDLLFAYNDVALYTDLFPAPPSFATIDNKAARLDQVDDHTVSFSFKSPNGLFLSYLATPLAYSLTARPLHYLRKFHKKYNPDVDELVKQEGQPSWTDLFFAKANLTENAELPRIHPWKPRKPVTSGGRVTFERNPYYWKVDSNGSQLPYLDRVIFDHVNDFQVSVLKAGNGELDFESRRFFVALSEKPVLARNRSKGNYHFLTVRSLYGNNGVLFLNLTHEDPVKRETFQNKDFRIGLSHAINRQQIIDTVYQGQGEPAQVSPRPDSPYYDEEMAKQYTEYDQKKANAALDRAGYMRSDSGKRLGPDGKPITFAVDVESTRPDRVNAVELVRKDLARVGIDVRTRAEGRSLFFERVTANKQDADYKTAGGGGGLLPPLRTDYWFPSGNGSRMYAPLWLEWYQSLGQHGERPPEAVRRHMTVYRSRVRPAVDEGERKGAMKEVLAMCKEYFYHIGISRWPDGYGIARNDFHNVPNEFPQGWYYPSPGPTNPEQYFTTEES